MVGPGCGANVLCNPATVWWDLTVVLLKSLAIIAGQGSICSTSPYLMAAGMQQAVSKFTSNHQALLT